MSLRQEVFAVTACVILLAVIVELVRQRRLSEYHSGMWLLFGCGMLILVVWYGALEFLTRQIGAVLVTTTVFILAFLFLTAVCIHMSTELTRLHRLVRTLTQEIALIEGKFDEHVASGESQERDET